LLGERPTRVQDGAYTPLARQPPMRDLLHGNAKLMFRYA
jgi:hypothetical protein